jgi:hypothetical protein
MLYFCLRYAFRVTGENRGTNHKETRSSPQEPLVWAGHRAQYAGVFFIVTQRKESL